MVDEAAAALAALDAALDAARKAPAPLDIRAVEVEAARQSTREASALAQAEAALKWAAEEEKRLQNEALALEALARGGQDG